MSVLGVGEMNTVVLLTSLSGVGRLIYRFLFKGIHRNFKWR